MRGVSRRVDLGSPLSAGWLARWVVLSPLAWPVRSPWWHCPACAGVEVGVLPPVGLAAGQAGTPVGRHGRGGGTHVVVARTWWWQARGRGCAVVEVVAQVRLRAWIRVDPLRRPSLPAVRVSARQGDVDATTPTGPGLREHRRCKSRPGHLT